jgi:hypothetical protein
LTERERDERARSVFKKNQGFSMKKTQLHTAASVRATRRHRLAAHDLVSPGRIVKVRTNQVVIPRERSMQTSMRFRLRRRALCAWSWVVHHRR